MLPSHHGSAKALPFLGHKARSCKRFWGPLNNFVSKIEVQSSKVQPAAKASCNFESLGRSFALYKARSALWGDYNAVPNIRSFQVTLRTRVCAGLGRECVGMRILAGNGYAAAGILNFICEGPAISSEVQHRQPVLVSLASLGALGST